MDSSERDSDNDSGSDGDGQRVTRAVHRPQNNDPLVSRAFPKWSSE